MVWSSVSSTLLTSLNEYLKSSIAFLVAFDISMLSLKSVMFIFFLSFRDLVLLLP